MYKTLFFDLGNVLLFFSHEKMIKQISELYEIPFQNVKEAMHTYGDAYERGEISSEEIFAQLNTISKKNVSYEEFTQAVSNIFEPNTLVIDFALKLKEKGYPIFILSNTCDAHFEFASKHYPFLQAFNGYILSYEVGARKPETKIFKKALEIAQCEPSQCFYTDDIPEYIEAARQMQIDAEAFTSIEELKKHFVKRGII